MAAKDEFTFLNAATKGELKLEERAQFYHVDNKVVIGDLYRDPYDPSVAIISVLREVELKEIEDIIPKPEHNRREEDKIENKGAETQEGEISADEKARLDILKKNL